MKKILFSLLVLLVATSLSAQITVFEYKEEGKAYCTFEFDSPLSDSIEVRGLYRAYEYLNVHYFDMVFYAKSHVSEEGITTISVRPDFYNHANLVKLMGEREHMEPNAGRYVFALEGDVLTHVTPEAELNKLQHRSSFTKKTSINVGAFPEVFTKVKVVDWKKIPKDLRANLQGKDKTFSRRY